MFFNIVSSAILASALVAGTVSPASAVSAVAPVRVASASPSRIVWTASGVYTDLVTSDGHEWRVMDEYAGVEFLVVFSTQGMSEVEDDVIVDIIPLAWIF